jgi:TolA-binding protein
LIVVPGGYLLLEAPAIREVAKMGDELEQARAMIGPQWPQLTTGRATTSGEIYLENLNGQIESLERRRLVEIDERWIARLALLRYHRFQISGDIEDAEAARKRLSEAWEQGAGTRLAVAYARVLIGFHEFEKADSVLRAAEEAGGQESAVLELRNSLARVRGEATAVTGEAESIDESLAPVVLVGMAADLAAHGWPAAASRALKLAQDRYVDTSPYTLAWIHVQQGIIFLDHKDYASARLFFAAAHQRFPGYTLAAEHLAETELALGHFEAAARLYRAVVANSGHPEFYHQLAKAERALGNTASANRHATLAAEGYQELVRKHPRMYADHAARYYIEIGEREPAVELASLNLSQRGDGRAKELLATARECCR